MWKLKRRVAWVGAGGVALSAIAAAQTPPADVALCGAPGCVPLGNDYANRLASAYASNATTDVQREKMRAIVAANKSANMIDWLKAADDYFSWRNGKNYVLDEHPQRPLTGQDNSTLRRLAEANIRDGLVDPESAKFKWPYDFVYGEWKTPKRYQGLLTCGLVNARNRMGGYSGDSWFVVVIDHNQVIYSDVDSGVGKGLNSYLCEKAAGRLPPLAQ